MQTVSFGKNKKNIIHLTTAESTQRVIKLMPVKINIQLENRFCRLIRLLTGLELNGPDNIINDSKFI